MRVSAFLIAIVATSVLSAPVAAKSKPDQRAQIEAFVDERGLPDGADRACVVDRAVKEHPNVPLTLVGPRLSGAAKAQHDENVRRIRIALAVKTGVEACSPTAAGGN